MDKLVTHWGSTQNISRMKNIIKTESFANVTTLSQPAKHVAQNNRLIYNNAQDSDKMQEESIDELSPPVHCPLCSVQVIQMCRNHCFAFGNNN